MRDEEHLGRDRGRFGPLESVATATLENRHHAPYLCAQIWGELSAAPATAAARC